MLHLRRLALLTGLAAFAGGGLAIGAPPKPGDFRGQAAAPYQFGIKRNHQDIYFTASANKRAIVKLHFLRCTATVPGTDVRFNFSFGKSTIRAQVSKSGTISGKVKVTKGDMTATQTISGKFTSRTRAKGSIDVSYAGTAARPDAKCVTGGAWSAKRVSKD